MIYLAFLAIPLADLFHVVVTATEIAYLGFLGQAEFWTSLYQVGLPVLLGNTVGGVFFVTIVNYFQTPGYIRDDSENRLPLKKWLFSWDEGRDKLLFRKQR